jgi:tyrosinase
MGDVIANTTFTNFTSVNPIVAFGGGLEGIHNGVHDWFVKSTMNDLAAAAADPIFWMHHANIDRCWTFWTNIVPLQMQDNYPDRQPQPGSGPEDIMDPWSANEPSTRLTTSLGYVYGG